MVDKSKYKNFFGLCYEVFTYDINTYIILKRGNKLKYKFYKGYSFSSQKVKEKLIKFLEKEGFKDIDNYKSQFESKVKLLSLENPIDLYSKRPDRS